MKICQRKYESRRALEDPKDKRMQKVDVAIHTSIWSTREWSKANTVSSHQSHVWSSANGHSTYTDSFWCSLSRRARRKVNLPMRHTVQHLLLLRSESLRQHGTLFVWMDRMQHLYSMRKSDVSTRKKSPHPRFLPPRTERETRRRIEGDVLFNSGIYAWRRVRARSSPWRKMRKTIRRRRCTQASCPVEIFEHNGVRGGCELFEKVQDRLSGYKVLGVYLSKQWPQETQGFVDSGHNSIGWRASSYVPKLQLHHSIVGEVLPKRKLS